MGCYPCGVQSYELFFNITQKSVILFIHGAHGGHGFFIHGGHGGHGSSEFIHGAHGGHGSSEFRRNLYGWFGVACRQEIFGGNL